MEGPVKGDVIVIPFPYSDLTNAKRRPALVIATSSFNDIILCQITSRDMKDDFAISLDREDFVEGSLPKQSNIRPNKLFTADSGIVLYKAGTLSKQKTNEIIDKIVDILKN